MKNIYLLTADNEKEQYTRIGSADNFMIKSHTDGTITVTGFDAEHEVTFDETFNLNGEWSTALITDSLMETMGEEWEGEELIKATPELITALKEKGAKF